MVCVGNFGHIKFSGREMDGLSLGFIEREFFMFKKLAAAAAVSMAMAAPAMADAGFETGTTGWWWQVNTTQVDQVAYGSSVNVDWFGAPQAVTVSAASNAVGAGSYFGLLSKGSTFGAQTDYFGGASVAGDKLWLSILSGDNASNTGYTGLSVADGGDWTYVTFYGNSGAVLGTPDAITTGMACGGTNACTIENNWFYYDVPVGTVGYVITLRQGDETNVAKLAIDYTSAAAVPEPETYAMLLAGLGAVGFMARRRSKAA